jgi:copper chaperone CopZ
MTNLRFFILILIATTIIACSSSVIPNAKIETIKVYGNCNMCKKTIEKAINLELVATGKWDTDTKMATITFDSTKTNLDEIKDRIALSGYDMEKYFAPDDIYASLPECCQYERAAKPVIPVVDSITVDSIVK